MSLVYYRLNAVQPIRDFVSAPIAGGGYAAANNPLPANTGAIYVIINSQHNLTNFYVGVSSNIRNRYNPLQERLHHLGFHQNDLNHMAIYYGTVHYWNTANLYPAGVYFNHGPFGAAGSVVSPGGVAQPAPAIVPGNTVANYSPNSMPVSIDGAQVDLEYLLLKYYLSAHGGGWTNTNTQGLWPITNGRASDMRVLINFLAPGGGWLGLDATLQGTVNHPPNGETW